MGMTSIKSGLQKIRRVGQRNKVLTAAAFVTLMAGIFGLTATAYASMPDGNGNYHLASGQTVDHVLFAAGRQVTIDGDVNGDLFCAGQDVTVSGHVSGDVICAARTIRVSGQVDGDVRVAGETVSVESQIDGSLSAAGQSLTVDTKTNVSRDASLAGNDVTVNGEIGRDLRAAGRDLFVGGKIGRDVEADSEHVVLASSANINHDLNYTSQRNVDRDAGAHIGGQLMHHQPQSDEDQQPDRGSIFGFGLFVLMAMLVTAIVLAAIFPHMFWRASDVAGRRWLKTLLVGFLAAIAAPVVMIVLAVTLVGIPLAIMAFVAWLLIMLLSGPFAAFVLGRALLRRNNSAVIVMLAGSLVIAVAYLVPVLDAIAAIAALWFGIGTIMRYGWSLREAPAVSTSSATVAAAHDQPKPKVSKPKTVRKAKENE